MEIRQLKYFVTLAKCKNFTKAAQQLYISQPTLSQQIVALEKAVNCKLLDRSNKKVELTPVGNFLFQEAEALINHYDDLLLNLDNFNSSNKGRLKLATLNNIELTFLPKFLELFHEKYPDIEIVHFSNTFSELLELIKNRTVDLTVNLCLSNHSYTQMDVLNIAPNNDRLVLISFESSDFKNITSFDDPNISELLQQQLYLYRGWHSYETTLELIRKYNKDLSISYYDNLTDFLLIGLKKGGYTILPEVFFYTRGGNKWYHTVPLPYEYGSLDLTLHYHKNTKNPCSTVFVQELEHYLKENKISKPPINASEY